MEPISKVMFSLYRGTPQHADWLVACLEGAWPSFVGHTIARICRPHIFHAAELVVLIEEPAWENALNDLRDELLEKIRVATGGEVRRLSFIRRD